MYNSLVYHVDKWKKNIKIPFGNCRRSVANIWVKKKGSVSQPADCTNSINRLGNEYSLLLMQFWK